VREVIPLLRRCLFVAAGSFVCAMGAQSPVNGTRNVQVVVPVSVTDSLGRSVRDLPPEAFHVFENRVEQRFSLVDRDAPLSIGIIADTSSSMSGHDDLVRRAVDYFFKGVILNSKNEAFVVEFNDRPMLVQGWTHDTNAVVNALASGEPHGKTALIDAVYLGLNEMQKAANARRLLLVISDGHDTSSRYTVAEATHRAMESRVQIFGIGLVDTPSRQRMNEAEFAAFRSLVEPTGGRFFGAAGNEALDASSKIALDLDQQYLILWTSASAARDGGFRKVQVRLTPGAERKSLRVSSPAGYYAPSQ
jgi:Ca-activated chloride channel family protein